MRCLPSVPLIGVGVAAISGLTSAQTIEIKLQANESITTTLGHDDADLIYFQPYHPTPSEPMSCAQDCPCFTPGVPTCGCPIGMVCGGNIPLDLSSGDTLKFVWEASDDDEKYISITGNKRTRVEFRGQLPNCEEPLQDIVGDDINFELDDSGINDAMQKYTYNDNRSFLVLGACDDGSCNECEITLRLQFDPDSNGVLDMKFKSLTVQANYDNQKVGQGIRDYEWATNSYTWIRQPEGGLIELLGGKDDDEDATSDQPTPGPTVAKPGPTPSPSVEEVIVPPIPETPEPTPAPSVEEQVTTTAATTSDTTTVPDSTDTSTSSTIATTLPPTPTSEDAAASAPPTPKITAAPQPASNPLDYFANAPTSSPSRPPIASSGSYAGRRGLWLAIYVTCVLYHMV